MQRNQFIRGCLLSLASLGLSLSAVAQEKFPSKPVRIIVSFGAGGSGDIIARVLAAQLSEILGQQFIVENRAGGAAIPGTDYVAKSQPDGYTMLQFATTLSVNTILQPNLPYDLFRDFTPVYITNEASLVLLTPGTSPNRKVADLLTSAKASPKGLSYGHGGSGSLSHLSGELFSRSMGINAVSVAYKGNAPAMNDLIGGRLDYYFSTLSDMLPNITAGRLNALAVTSSQRDPLLPNVPTMVELGYKDFTPVVSWGYLVPKNTPAPVVKQLSDAIAKALKSPVVQERFNSVGASSRSSGGPDVMAARMRADIARWEPVIKAANIKPE